MTVSLLEDVGDKLGLIDRVWLLVIDTEGVIDAVWLGEGLGGTNRVYETAYIGLPFASCTMDIGFVKVIMADVF